ncbi:MAG: ribonuclease R [Bacteroidales bacterium]|nr:ribonuclease R [Bacteroidales bacterium]
MGSKRRIRKEKKKSGSFAETVLKVFAQNPFKGYNFRQLSHVLGIKDSTSRELVRDILDNLAEEKSIILEHRGKYKLNPELIDKFADKSIVTGVVDMKQTGKAYIISEECEEDVFISANNVNHALHGDTVKVHLFPKRAERKLEGQIVEILSRQIKQIVGVLQISPRFAFLIPDKSNIQVDVFIPKDKLNGAKNGQKAIAQLTDWPDHANNPFGEITEVLGEPGVHEVEMHSILAAYNFNVTFPKKVLDEAEKVTDKISASEIKKRRDFRDVFTCTIDPLDAKDFDDAISLKKLPNGNWEVGIHIADVSHYVKPGTAIEAEAYERATSVYLVDRTVPMLPEKLSNMVCSLRQDEEKCTFSAVFEMDDQAKIHNEWFGKTVICSNRRFVYEEVQEMIEGADGDYKDELMVLNNLATLLREKRYEKGSISFRSKEVKFRLDEDGKPIEAFIKEQKEANQLVEDFMLLANKKVAEKIGKKKGKSEVKTFVYRIHDVPNEEKLEKFATFVGKLGYKFNTSNRKGISESLNKLFKDVEGKGEEHMVETIAVRTMAKAEYSTQNIGHYGLGFSHYSHFTSPIRRYPDLMVHRLLESYLEGGKSADASAYEEMCSHSSQMERKATEAERESIKYKQVEYMTDKVGKEFWGIISGVSKWGIFVELNETMAEGLISMRGMDDDFYHLDEENYRIIGQKNGREFKLGSPIRVEVKGIDLAKKQMDLGFID